MNWSSQSFWLIFTSIYTKIEFLLGLSSTINNTKADALKNIASLIIRAFYLIIFPISFIRVLDFSERTTSNVSTYARNFTFVLNWTFLAAVYASKTFQADKKQLELRWKSLGCKIISQQSRRENFVFLLQCILKVVSLVILTCLVYRKYDRYLRKNLNFWEKKLFIFPLVPFSVLKMTSHKLFMINTIVKNILAKSFQPAKMRNFQFHYINLQKFFEDFNNLNSVNILAITTFCCVHIIYEVSR